VIKGIYLVKSNTDILAINMEVGSDKAPQLGALI